jgi:hypothetical protein
MPTVAAVREADSRLKRSCDWGLPLASEKISEPFAFGLRRPAVSPPSDSAAFASSLNAAPTLNPFGFPLPPTAPGFPIPMILTSR